MKKKKAEPTTIVKVKLTKDLLKKVRIKSIQDECSVSDVIAKLLRGAK